MAMLKGNSKEVIDTNIKHLKENGYTEANATRVALRHSKRRNVDKLVSKIVKKVTI